MTRLGFDFFNRPTLNVAKDLIGQTMVYQNIRGIITETEAYIGDGLDESCHAHRGETKRNAMMFAPPGHAYVYFTYGMHYCLNLVTEEERKAAAVLIRGLYVKGEEKLLDGPAKLTKFCGITTDQNGVDITHAGDFYIEKSDLKLPYTATPRIGISKSTDLPWRFVVGKKELSLLQALACKL